MNDTQRHHKTRGFTLLEIIITIVVAGILASLLIPFMGSALHKSHEPVERLKESLKVNECMAKLVAQCRDSNSVSDCINDFDEEPCNAYFSRTCGKFSHVEDTEYEIEYDGSCADPSYYLIRVYMTNPSIPSHSVSYIFIR